MTARIPVCVACVGALLAAPGPSRAEAQPLRGLPAADIAFAPHPSEFALPMLVDTPVPELTLAQRTISRHWGPSDDSTYVEIALPDWKSEGGAMLASVLVPGSGHLYVGENTGYLFLLAEAAGWTARTLYRQRADDRRDEGASYAGSPTDPGSAWSATRWAQATGGDPAELIALYQGDRDAFLKRIATDPALLAGWSGSDPAATRGTLDGLIGDADQAQRRANYAGAALWLNHLVAAADALRAARIHNIPIQRNLEIQLKSNWKSGGPGFRVALSGRF